MNTQSQKQHIFVLSLAVLLAACADSGFKRASSSNSAKRKELPATPNNCAKSVDLPDQPVALKELFRWQASGPTARYNQVMATPVVAKLKSSDKTPSIIAPAFIDQPGADGPQFTTNGGYLYAIDSRGKQRWVSTMKVHPTVSAAIGNIDNDASENEVVVLGLDHKVHALRSDGSLLWSTANPAYDPGIGWFHYIAGPSIGDVDGDGAVEIIMRDQVLRGNDGSLKFTLNDYPSVLDPVYSESSFIADVNLDGKNEIVAAHGVYTSDGSRKCSFAKALRFMGAARMRKNERYLTIIGRHSTSIYPSSDVADPIIAYNGSTCVELFSTVMPGGGGGPVNIADFDGDGTLEFGLGGAANYAVFETDGSLKWKRATKDSSSAATGSTAFDFNGDGKTEVVYNDEDHLMIMSGSEGKLHFKTLNSSGTIVEYPVIADIDGDGHANLIVAANDVFHYTNKVAHGIRVFSAPNNDWTGTRPVWNQYAYSGNNVGNNGAISDLKIADYWTKATNLSYLLGFRNNESYALPKDHCKNK